jgi:hypothetical protein
MPARVDLAVIAGVALFVIPSLVRNHAARYGLESLHHIPTEHVTAAAVSLLVPVSLERRDAIAVVYDEHPSVLLVHHEGVSARPQYVSSIPASVSIVGGIYVHNINAMCVLTQRLSVVALSMDTFTILWKTRDLVGADGMLNGGASKLVRGVEEGDEIVVVSSLSNGSILHGLFRANDAARPPSVLQQWHHPGEHAREEAMLSSLLSSSRQNSNSSARCWRKLSIVSLSGSGLRFREFVVRNVSDLADLTCFMLWSHDVAAVGTRNSLAYIDFHIGPASPTSLASVYDVELVEGGYAERYHVYRRCLECPVIVNRTYVALGDSAADLAQTDEWKLEKLPDPPLCVDIMQNFETQDSAMTSSGILVIAGSFRSGRRGIVTAIDIKRKPSKTLWRRALPEPSLWLYYSSAWRHVVLVTKRHVVVLESSRGRVVATVRLDARGGIGLLTRQRHRLGLSRAGTPSGLVVEESGVVWFAMRGGECAALGVDLRRILVAPWSSDAVAVLTVFAAAVIAQGIHFWVERGKSKTKHSQRRASSAQKGNGPASSSAWPVSRPASRVPKRHKSFGKKDL